MFDDPATWEQSLREALGELYSSRLNAMKEPHEYAEDALDTLEIVDKTAIRRVTVDWLSQRMIAAYHGTRLNLSELQSIRNTGLRALNSEHREDRLIRTLSKHPDWNSISSGLPDAIDSVANKFGKRLGQAHLTLSKFGLEKSFNHYLQYGSEFDQCVAHVLLGQEGVGLLQSDNIPYVLEFAVPGAKAIAAANRFFTVDEAIVREDGPNLVREFLKVLSCRTNHASFDQSSLRVDCGITFTKDIPAEWLHSSSIWTGRDA
ncbi:hypothetical protein WKH86_14150 [Xanthomonas oryzae pv. oryzae]